MCRGVERPTSRCAVAGSEEPLFSSVQVLRQWVRFIGWLDVQPGPGRGAQAKLGRDPQEVLVRSIFEADQGVLDLVSLRGDQRTVIQRSQLPAEGDVGLPLLAVQTEQ